MIVLNINMWLNRTFGVLWLPCDDCREYTYVIGTSSTRDFLWDMQRKGKFFCLHKYMNYTD